LLLPALNEKGQRPLFVTALFEAVFNYRKNVGLSVLQSLQYQLHLLPAMPIAPQAEADLLRQLSQTDQAIEELRDKRRGVVAVAHDMG
jgi:hypothetical protein